MSPCECTEHELSVSFFSVSVHRHGERLKGSPTLMWNNCKDDKECCIHVLVWFIENNCVSGTISINYRYYHTKQCQTVSTVY